MKKYLANLLETSDIADILSYAGELMELGNIYEMFNGMSAAHAISVIYKIDLYKEVAKCLDYFEALSAADDSEDEAKLFADMNLMNIYAAIGKKDSFEAVLSRIETECLFADSALYTDSIPYYRLSGLARFDDLIPNERLYLEELRLLMEQLEYCPEAVDDLLFTFKPILDYAKKNLEAEELIKYTEQLIDISKTKQDALGFYDFLLNDCQLSKEKRSEALEQQYRLLYGFYKNRREEEFAEIKNKLLSFKLERRFIKNASTDTLTGLGNRYAYKSALQRAQKELVAEKKKGNSKLVILVADINGLKETNDTFGHQAGDELIHNAAKSLNLAFGSYGELFRIGGDEFTIIMQADKKRVEDCINSLDIILKETKNSFGEPLNIALGYAMASEKEKVTVDALVDTADKRMYADKEKFYIETGKPRR